MTQSNRLMRLFLTVAIAGMIFSTGATAQKIMWVGSTLKGADSVITDQSFVDLLVANGFTVEVQRDSMKGTLTPEKIALLESADLIIFSRASGSGDYIDPAGWNALTKPLILNSVYCARGSKWQWVNTENLVGGGNAGCPKYHAEEPGHPIFTGVSLDADGNVLALDTTVGTGQTSLLDYNSFGEGELIATAVPNGVVAVNVMAIVYWAKDAVFSDLATYAAGAPRLLFSCQAREGGAFAAGMYNLTPAGQKMYLNAINFMLGNPVGISEKPGAVPAGYRLEQNYPNPFNPSTRIAFSLPSACVTKLSVYNVLGQEINVIAEGMFQAGRHEFVWNGCDSYNNSMPSGVYMVQMRAGDKIQAQKMILMK